MTPKTYYYAKSREQIEGLAKKAKTSVGNFQQIAVAGGSCGKNLAERLAKASEYEMTEMEILYPERFTEGGTAA